jgi:hypothetical protein
VGSQIYFCLLCRLVLTSTGHQRAPSSVPRAPLLCSLSRLLCTCRLLPIHLQHAALMFDLKAGGFPETSAHMRATRHYIPEDGNIRNEVSLLFLRIRIFGLEPLLVLKQFAYVSKEFLQVVKRKNITDIFCTLASLQEPLNEFTTTWTRGLIATSLYQDRMPISFGRR